MFHQNRTFGVADVQTTEELAEELTSITWTLCTGFRLQGLLFLNDSFSEDHSQEYAVIRESDRCQLESITFGWCDKPKAISCIKECLAITGDGFFGKLDKPLKIDDYKTHHCRLCA